MALHIPCPYCDSINRVPRERLVDKPKCGQCKRALFSGAPIDLSESNFTRVTGKSDLPVIVDFWAPWCAPCKMMAPAFAQAAQNFATRAVLAKLNTEIEARLGQQFNIRSIPTLVVFREGREAARQSGALNLADLTQFIERQLP